MYSIMNVMIVIQRDFLLDHDDKNILHSLLNYRSYLLLGLILSVLVNGDELVIPYYKAGASAYIVKKNLIEELDIALEPILRLRS